MKCPFCGSEYDSTALKCPFCGAENTKEARERQKETLHALDTERKNIRRLPEELLRQTNRKAFHFGKKLLFFAVLLFLLLIAGSFLWKFYSEFRQSHHLKQLEQMLQEQDYDGLAEKIDQIDSYSPIYGPYIEIYWVFQYISQLQEDLEWFRQEKAQGYGSAEILSFSVVDSLMAIYEASCYLEDELVRGNEEALETLRLQAWDALTDTLLFTEDEVQEMLTLVDDNYYGYGDEQMCSYAEISLKRME